MLLVTAGMIGVGKTTLTKELAEHLGTNPFYEPVADNPILPLYYKDPKRYGFALQIFFLNRRFDAMKKAQQDDNDILDRSIYEDKYFTHQNVLDGNITEAEYQIYSDLLDNMMQELPYAAHKKAPDLLIYLHAPFETILEHIEKRGREYEQLDTDPDRRNYYHRLWSGYDAWYEQYNASPKISIDLSKHDLSTSEGTKTVLGVIDRKLKEIR